MAWSKPIEASQEWRATFRNPPQDFALRTLPDIPFAETEPASRGDFLLREKLDAFLALHVKVAEKRFVPAVERKPGHGSGHADVDAHHTALNAMLELARGLAGAGKDRSPIAVGGTVRQFNRAFQIVKPHHVQHRAENFLLGHRHSGLNFIEHRGAQKKAIR